MAKKLADKAETAGVDNGSVLADFLKIAPDTYNCFAELRNFQEQGVTFSPNHFWVSHRDGTNSQSSLRQTYERHGSLKGVSICSDILSFNPASSRAVLGYILRERIAGRRCSAKGFIRELGYRLLHPMELSSTPQRQKEYPMAELSPEWENGVKELEDGRKR